MDNLVKHIAEDIENEGGRAYYVGGCVRDTFLGKKSHDTDIEVHGISPDVLTRILKKTGKYVSVGKSFGIYKMCGFNLDIAMPRKEYCTGKGHRDFEIAVDPYIGTYNAAKRRDFTVNAIMRDVLSGEIIDHFGGIKDIDNGIIRHIDDSSFAEDALRVLRAAQFASRFLFIVHDSTVKLSSGIDLSYLSSERVEEEMKKALVKGQKPSVFFEILRKMNQLDCWFPELKKMIGLKQDSVYHPEGDVWTHTMQVLDRAALFREDVSDAYSFMLLALLHDVGKLTTTEVRKGRIHSYGHENEKETQNVFLSRIVHDNDVKKYVENMTLVHMKPNRVAFSKPHLKKTNHMFDEAYAPKDLIFFAECDRTVMAGEVPFDGDREFLLERYQKYMDTMSQPYVTGQNLIDMGLEPGKNFSEILDFAHKLRLAGIKKEDALKQVEAMAGIRKKK